MEQPTPTDPERPPEHAFGKIHEITIPLQWTLTPTNARRKARGFVAATTVTWSVNGAGFTSATNPQVMASSIVTVKIGPVEGEAIVRSTHPTEVDGTSYYGVEFVSDDLQTVARDLISIHLRHRPEERPVSASPLDIADPNQSEVHNWT